MHLVGGFMKFYDLLKGASIKADELASFRDDKEDYCLKLFNVIHYYKERSETLDMFYKALKQNLILQQFLQYIKL